MGFGRHVRCGDLWNRVAKSRDRHQESADPRAMIEQGWPDARIEAHIRALAVWREPIRLEPLAGGLCNRSWIATSGSSRHVVRVGFDIPIHGIHQASVQTSMAAAATLGVAPRVIHAEPNLTVTDFLDGGCLTSEQVLDPANLAGIVERLRRLHDGGRATAGTLGYFWPFQAVRRYIALGRARGARLAARLDEVECIADRLERAVRPFLPVFTHNDLVPQNLMFDGAGRVWFVDWDYGGFGHPMFDLAALGANADGDEDDDRRVLAHYYGGIDEALWRDFVTFKLALSLREWMWGMAQELTSTLAPEAVRASMSALYPGREQGYEGYTNLNGERFERSWRLYRDLFPAP